MLRSKLVSYLSLGAQKDIDLNELPPPLPLLNCSSIQPYGQQHVYEIHSIGSFSSHHHHHKMNDVSKTILYSLKLLSETQFDVVSGKYLI